MADKPPGFANLASLNVPTSVCSAVPGVVTEIFPSGVIVISFALVGIVT